MCRNVRKLVKNYYQNLFLVRSHYLKVSLYFCVTLFVGMSYLKRFWGHLTNKLKIYVADGSTGLTVCDNFDNLFFSVNRAAEDDQIQMEMAHYC